MRWQNGVFTDGITTTVSGKKAIEHHLTPQDEKIAQALIKRNKQSRAKNTKADIRAFKTPGLEYLPYQKAGIEYMCKVKQCLLADDQGLGKTIQI